MNLLATYFFLFGLSVIAVQACPQTCVFNKLEALDADFCSVGLEVLYPELGDVGCSYIPSCNQFRKSITKEWRSPDVRYQKADRNKKYVLIMVDPDAPSRANPKYSYWRHWVVINIRGDDLKIGNVKGRVLSDYIPPTPPSGSGFHRYQFRIFKQPEYLAIFLNAKEKAYPGYWDMDNFVYRFGLGEPVASTQFLTQNYKDED